MLLAAANYKILKADLETVKMLPCIDQATLDRLLGLFAQLEAYANAEGVRFIANGDPDHAKASVDATKWADELQPLITFIKSMPICAGPMPWDPPPGGGGGLTDGPNNGWPEGVVPPSRTEIPPCLNDWAKTLIDVLEKKIPEEEKNIASLKVEMDTLRQDIIDLSSGQARAKDKGEQPDPSAQQRIENDQARYSGLAFQFKSAELQLKWDREDLAKLRALKPCPDDHTYYVPGTGNGEQYVTYATDSTTHCTYTGGTFTTSLVTSLTDGAPGAIVPGSDTPPASVPPTAPSGQPQTAALPDRPTRPDYKPSPTPPTTETTPAAPDDTPSDIPDNVELKVTQDVLEGGRTGGPIEGQTIKLLLTEKSDLPVPIDPKAPLASQRAADAKFDRPPSQCTTDAKGGCKIPVSPEDRSAYRLASPKKGQQRTYRLDIARPQTSGGVAEVTPGKEKVDPKALQSLGSKIVASTFKIGNRNFIRFALESKYGIDAPLGSKLKEAYGPSYEEDLCKEKYPGRLLVDEILGASETSGSELPGSTLALNDRHSKRRASR